jgi:light-regulated signal transduction histidine kinase (bacteriophytochrome)
MLMIELNYGIEKAHCHVKNSASKEIESFTSMVAHDLRLPLNNIAGCAEALKTSLPDIDTKNKFLIDTITGQCEIMSQLILDFLALSEVSYSDMVKEDVDMDTLVHSIINEQIRFNTERKIITRIDKLPGLKGDSNMLRHVWVNLISNAIKYSGKKEQSVIEIGCSTVNGSITYYIKDNGIGFDMKQADKLFVAFSRLHNKNEFEGTGIGLTIVHKVITKHKGKIWAESIPGEGSVFYFSLPRS